VDMSEKIVYQYLAAQGFTDVVYEPDGNVMPDFLVDGRIAVEVRRLNQHEETNAGLRGLEEVAMPLSYVVKQVLDSMGPSRSGPSWFVVYEYQRPLPSWQELKRALTRTLKRLGELPDVPQSRINVAPHFDIWLIRSTNDYPMRFLPGACIDHDRGGCVLSEMRRNLEICMAEKSRKAANVQSRYPEWWFVLVDHIGGELTVEELQQLRALVTIEQPWEKVILVNPSHPERGLEL